MPIQWLNLTSKIPTDPTTTVDSGISLLHVPDAVAKQINAPLTSFNFAGFYTYPCSLYMSLSLSFSKTLFSIRTDDLNLGKLSEESTDCVGGIISVDSQSEFPSNLAVVGGITTVLVHLLRILKPLKKQKFKPTGGKVIPDGTPTTSIYAGGERDTHYLMPRKAQQAPTSRLDFTQSPSLLPALQQADTVGSGSVPPGTDETPLRKGGKPFLDIMHELDIRKQDKWYKDLRSRHSNGRARRQVPPYGCSVDFVAE
ncbi:hypothetical protein BC835DRAFT_1311242 [Cytidiella melzeri]|nr:hypothetical protein BC835DRAFT_1311242 [Cytidiella melzeri]